MNYYCKGDHTYHYKSELPKTLQPFVDFQFSTGGVMGEDAKSFLRKYRNAITKLLPDGFKLYGWHPNHYCASGVIQNVDGAFIYFSISDIRYWQNEWFTNILYRQMRHDQDWTGGINHYTTLFTFTKDIENLYK